MKLLKSLAAAAVMVALTGVAQAALISRAGGMIYDSTLNITWLQNWNTNGLMDWTTAKNWANNLVYGGFHDWRLPTANTTASSNCNSNFNPGGFPQQYLAYNCTGSELGNMFYTEFGATTGQSILSGSNAANLALFTNVQSDIYWSGTEYAPNPGLAWTFYTYQGNQNFLYKFTALHAVAVRPGDVAASVPEPQTLALALLALGATMVARRRRPG